MALSELACENPSAGVGEPFSLIIDQCLDHCTEIIVRVHEHASAKNYNLYIRKPEVGINWTR